MSKTISRGSSAVLAMISWISRRAIRCLRRISLLGASQTLRRSVASDSSVSRSTCTNRGATFPCAYPDIEGLIQEQASEMDGKKREAILQRIQQLIHDKAMVVPI